MKPILKWQYEQIVKVLLLIQGHAADAECPCASEGEMCMRKHLLELQALCEETYPIADLEEHRQVLFDLTQEARELRALEESRLCGEELDEELDIVGWARNRRKFFEQASLVCEVAAGGPSQHSLVPAPAATAVKISGQCSEDVCRLRVQATDKTEASVASLHDLPAAVEEVLARHQESPAAVGSDRAIAYGSTELNRFEFRYRVVEADDLVASHNPDTFRPNPDYPQELQPRLRERAATQVQVNKMAANLDPEALLTDFQSLDRGTPIVGPDNIVESGNGRTMAILKAASDFPEAYARYRDLLMERARRFGQDPDQVAGMATPVLVRERLTDVSRKAFVEEANAATTIESSAIEKARTDAEKITLPMLESLEVGESQGVEDALRSLRNKAFVSAFLGKLPQNEQARLVDAHGLLNQDAVRRMTMALFIFAFPGDAGLILAEKSFESIDGNVRNVFNGIARVLAALAEMEGLVREGLREPDYSIADDLAAAVNVFSTIKKTPELTVSKYLAQSQMWERELTPFQERLLTFLDEHSRSARKIAEVLQNYTDLVISSAPPTQASMIDMPRASKQELFEQAVIRRQRELLPAPAPSSTDVCRIVQEARDTHLHFLTVPPDPKTGSHAFHRRWVDDYSKVLDFCRCHAASASFEAPAPPRGPRKAAAELKDEDPPIPIPRVPRGMPEAGVQKDIFGGYTPYIPVPRGSGTSVEASGLNECVKLCRHQLAGAVPAPAPQLMTQEIRKKIPPLYSTEKDTDPIVWAKYFAPWSQWTWYATEFDPDEEVCFGWVYGDFPELGYFSLHELAAVRGPYGLKVERDMYWEPRPLSEVKKLHEHGDDPGIISHKIPAPVQLSPGEAVVPGFAEKLESCVVRLKPRREAGEVRSEYAVCRAAQG